MRKAALALVVGCFILVSCSGDDSGDSGSENDDSSEEESVLDDDAGAMTQGLSLVPDDSSAALVIVNDYAAATEALDLDRPEAGDEDVEIVDWLLSVTTGEGDVVGGLENSGLFGARLFEDEAWRAEVGWAPIDADIAVDVRADEHQGYYAVIGDFDRGEIDDTVTDEDNIWEDELEVDEQNGTEYYTWGNEPGDLTVVRNFGRGGNMAVLDGALLWAWEPDVIEDGIDAATGEDDSLVDNDEFGPLAEAMDEAGAMGAMFSDDGHRFDDAYLDSALDDTFALEPYEAFATGVRIDDGRAEVLIALLHDDEDSAEQNAASIETVIDRAESVAYEMAWSDLVSLDSTEVDGSVLLATLAFDDPHLATLWSHVVDTRDTLLYAD